MKRISEILAVVLVLATFFISCSGPSAYEVAKKNGLASGMSESEWIESLKGKNGDDAYETAKKAGFKGSVAEWLESLRGKDGKSAYEIAKDNGYTKSESEWVGELLGSKEKNNEGAGISSVKVDGKGHLIVTLDNGAEIDAGYVGNAEHAGPSGKETEKVDGDGYIVVNETVIVNTGSLNIRSSPDSSRDDNIVARLNEWDEIVRVGTGTDGCTWSKVLLDGRVCYAATRFLEFRKSAEEDPSCIEVPKVNLPDEYTVPADRETVFEIDQFVVGLCEGMYASFEYDGEGSVAERSLTVKPAAGPSEFTFKIRKYVGGTLADIYSKKVRLVAVKMTDKPLVGIVIGDSRVSDGRFVDRLKSDFGDSLVLEGTKKTGSGNPHEGRGSWTTLNYLSFEKAADSLNPFINPAGKKFDFGYYLRKNGFDTPDFVVFYLGANDGYGSSSVSNYVQIIDSIKENDKNTEVYVLHEYLSPLSGYGTSSKIDIVERRDRQFRYFDKLGRLEREGVYLVPAHTCVKSTEYGDTVHLNASGYRKQADIVAAYISRFSGS